MDSDSERKINIKTEPTDEEVPEGSSEFFAAIKAHPDAEYLVLAKTPDWLCKKYKINQEDTITRIVGHIPATADSEPEYIIKTVGRVLIDSVTVKMVLDSRLSEVKIKEIVKGKDTLVQRFLLGGPNPSTPLVLSKASRTRMEILRNMEEEKERNTTGRRITDSDRKINIKTEPTDEEFPEDLSEFIGARKAHPNVGRVVKTPDWFCKKIGMAQRDTLTRIIGYVPATADHGPLYRLSTIGRVLVDDEAVKMVKDSFPGTQDSEKDPLLQRFLLDGPEPSARLVLGPSGRLMIETEGMQREKERKSMKRRIMTRKTTEREDKKGEIMESKRVRTEMTERERMERKRIEIEKMERRKTECLSFAFQCTYCGHQSNRLTSLKDHVLGTRTKIDRSRCLQIDCINRLIQDGLLEKYEQDAIPVTCPPPKKQPWAKIACKDSKLIDSEGKFAIPEDIAKEWLKFFKEMPT
ncbi:uncharacterized protein LOC107370744 isoform X3 [Tetranychus urticae]|uniref:Uncharacterized protein n=1 Tax=Tetranychus urticae TaxID=32264 RepID=T1JTV5_TETUR|nr:uncharacterized protein LOC107370744 isoform X1 [Tetranychus urticae]XP_015794195.1 uncharacterized protein LOC107370744 isoform X2 [Tetranychus urticae]XP_015794196.1 uncharacterized protein LOC107370744 isoform X3 [Tetranychus urticae]